MSAGPQRALPPEPPVDDRVSGNHLWLLHHCDRRLWLDRHASGEAAPGGEFEELLKRKGEEHEQAVRSRLSPCTGPLHWRGRPIEESVAETARLLAESRATLYQPALASGDGRTVGVPDFLYWEDGALVVHDAKLASDLKAHREIALQLTHYRALLADMGHPGARLEITTGRDEVLAVEPVPLPEYAAQRDRAAELLRGGPEPATLLAHSTCEACPFYDHCWDRAEAERRVGILPDVYVADVPLLEQRGVRTVDELAALAPGTLAWKGLGARGERMIHAARAHRDGRPVWLEPPALPAGRPLVWFDLEGVTELEDSPHPIYLWGLAVEDGGDDIAFEPIFAEPGEAGNRAAWERFVARASAILDASPGARFVHYASYEKTWVRKYAEMFGAPDGFVERMDAALWDLLYGAVLRCVRLPLRSSSIKKVAPYVGFRWSDPESGSLWSVVQYRKAMAARDEAERRRLLEPIARYNADDLRAMRAVWRWLEREGPRG